MISKVVGEGATSGDPTMDRSNIEDSSTRQSTQPAMSRNTRELATSLVEMKIASRDLPMAEATASQGKDGQQPPGDTTNALNEDPPTVDPMDNEDSHEDPMNVDDLPMGLKVNVAAEAESAKDQAGDAEGQARDSEEALLREEGVAQQKQSDPSLRDLPMTEANPVDSVDSMVIEKPANHSPFRIIDIVPFSPPPHSTQLEKTPHCTLEPIRMNVEVVDDTMRDLDSFSPTPKALVLCLQPLAVQEVPNFPDSSQVPLDNTFDDWDSDPNEPELNFNLYEGLTSKAVNEEVIDLDPVPQWRSSAERRDSANLGSRKGKKQLPWSLDASFDVGTASAPLIHEVRTKKGQTVQEGARMALGGRIRKEPLWQEQSNPVEVISKNM